MHIGSVAGVGMGLFFGTFEGAHGDIIGNTSSERIKYASKRLLKICWKMSYRYAYVLIQNLYIINRILVLLVQHLHM